MTTGKTPSGSTPVSPAAAAVTATVSEWPTTSTWADSTIIALPAEVNPNLERWPASKDETISSSGPNGTCSAVSLPS